MTKTTPTPTRADAFLAFLAPSASVAVRRGFLKLEDATFGLRELRAVVDAHGFEDWTNEELAHMLAPEAVGRPQRAATPTSRAAAAGTDPSAADARRRAAAAAAAAETRLGVSDLARLARPWARGGERRGGRRAPCRDVSFSVFGTRTNANATTYL